MLDKDETKSQEETTEDETTSTEEDETTEEEETEDGASTEDGKKKDPLDDMSDGDLKRFATTFGITLKDDATREEQLAEIKKVRGIKQRRVIETTTQDQPTDKGKDVMTKRDFEQSFEKNAIEDLEESQDAFDKAIVKHWDVISKRYVNHNGRDSKKNILKDIRAAAAGYFHAEGVEIEGQSDAATRISRITGLGVPSSSGRTKERKRVLQKRGGMTTWYGKK